VNGSLLARESTRFGTQFDASQATFLTLGPAAKAPPAAVTTTVPTRPDTNADGRIDLLDVQCVTARGYAELKGLAAPTCQATTPLHRADVDCSAAIDATDSQLASKMALAARLGQAGLLPALSDADQDSVHDQCDNCPQAGAANKNTAQTDANGDGVGDQCAGVCASDADCQTGRHIGAGHGRCRLPARRRVDSDGPGRRRRGGPGCGGRRPKRRRA